MTNMASCLANGRQGRNENNGKLAQHLDIRLVCSRYEVRWLIFGKLDNLATETVHVFEILSCGVCDLSKVLACLV